jgi:hypothetical protein
VSNLKFCWGEVFLVQGVDFVCGPSTKHGALILRARPGENHAKYQKSSKRVVAIYEFFMLNIFFIWAKVKILLKFYA